MSADYFSRLGTPIFAAATAKGGPLVVYRVSGKSLVGVANALELKPEDDRKAKYQRIFDVDSGVVVYFRGPRSFTGEDVLELHVHGSDRICELLNQVLLSMNISEALPGEFSFRAFANQKMTLAEAESLHFALTAATASDRATQLVNLSSFAQANTEHLFTTLEKSLAFARGRLESAIDFSEAVDEQAADVKSTHDTLAELARDLDGFLTTYQNHSNFLTPKIIILGEPNSGKSSLLNLLVGSDRSLVADTPGTTRDYIEAKIKLRNQDLTFVDTAGVRAAEPGIEEVEKKGIARALQLVKEATAVVWVQASDKPVDFALEQILSSHPTVVRVRSFGDRTHEVGALNLQIDRQKLRSQLECELLPKIAARRDTDVGQRELFISERQTTLLRELQANIISAVKALSANLSLELVAEDLRRADALLKKCRGKDLSDDYISEIFGQFCLGK